MKKLNIFVKLLKDEKIFKIHKKIYTINVLSMKNGELHWQIIVPTVENE